MLRLTSRALATSSGATQSAKLPSGKPKNVTWFRNSMLQRRVGSYKEKWGTGMENPSSGVPLQDQAKLHCVDNTNCKHLRLLKQGCERFHHHKVLPVVVQRVSLIRFKSGSNSLNRQKIKPGSVYWAVIFSRRQYNARRSGLVTAFDRNTAVLMSDKKVPLGTRVMYCAGRHINHKCHLKAAVLANFFL
jgi:large subunit ribosomal protein L14